LQIVQDMVGANEREDFADPGQEEDIVFGLGQLGADGGDQVLLDAQYVLQQLQKLVLFHLGLDGQDVVPEGRRRAAALPGLEQGDAEVVKIDVQDPDAAPLQAVEPQAGQLVDELPDQALHPDGFGGPELADVKRQIVVEPLHPQKALAADDLDQMLETGGQGLLAGVVFAVLA
jgi:hypothetical protein